MHSEEIRTVVAFGDDAIRAAAELYQGRFRNRALDADEVNREYEAAKSRIHVSEQGHRHEVVVDKRTHRIRYENETENEVTIVIEPK